MEGVLSPISLFNELSFCAPSEAVLKVFNILFPYSKPIPSYKENEVIMDEFFGNSYTKARNEVPIFIPDETQVKKIQKELEYVNKNYKELQEILKLRDKRILELEEMNRFALVETEKYKEMEKNAKKMLEDTIYEYTRKEDKSLIEDQLAEIKIKLVKTESRLKEVSELSYRYEKELNSRPKQSELDELREKLDQTQADNYNLRLKAGLIFLKALENNEESDPVAAEIFLQDFEVLKRFELSVKGKSGSLKTRLSDIDGNKDGKISKLEASSFFFSLGLIPQDIIVLLRCIGYRQGRVEIPIEDFLNTLDNLEEKEKEMQKKLFKRITEKFKANSVDLERAFEYLDLNHDGSVTFAEFSEGIDSIKVNLNREDKHALFAVLDKDHNGSINLHELLEKLTIEESKEKKNHIKKPVETEKKSDIKEKEKENEKVNVKDKQKEIDKNKDEKNNKKNTKETKTSSNRISGSLVIGIIRGKGLGSGNFSVQMVLDGSEKSIKTPYISSSDPEWRFKGRIRLYDTSKVLVSNEISAELINDKGFVGRCKIS